MNRRLASSPGSHTGRCGFWSCRYSLEAWAGCRFGRNSRLLLRWVQPFNDGAYWVLIQSFTYTIGQTSYQITVPAGFVTDFASIPAALRGFLSPTGQEGRAAIIHDYLYWEQRCSRDQADWILRLGMIESRVPLVTRQAVYWAVRAPTSAKWLAPRHHLTGLAPDPATRRT